MELPEKDQDMLNRLLEAIDKSGMKRWGRVTKLSKVTGYSVGMVSDMLAGKEPLGEKFIKIVCAALQISPQWLLDGSGVMKLGSAPIQPVIFAQLQTDNKILEMIIDELSRHSETEKLKLLLQIRERREAQEQALGS